MNMALKTGDLQYTGLNRTYSLTWTLPRSQDYFVAGQLYAVTLDGDVTECAGLQQKIKILRQFLGANFLV